MRDLLFAIVIACAAALPAQAQAQETVHVDARAKATPFPHFWERMFGSGHATLSLRASYRSDLRAVKRVADFQYVRFHGIFDDDVGVYNEDEHGRSIYNFTLVDQIYDGLLRDGVRPVVEIGFMPKRLAFNPDALHAFWYKPNVSPPKSYDKWDALVSAFAQHLVRRYGIDAVSKWYFEVWNEPNIDFWGGVPRQKSYFELYDHTARALKSVDPRLRVGGPATAAASWVGAFLEHAAKAHVPVDFVSTHGYADDTVENLFHNDKPVPQDDRVCRAVAKVQREIKASTTPNLPLLWTEWNVIGRDGARDTTYVGPALANTVRECDGMVDMMSFWTFSDVFEENGPSRAPFTGQFGLRASGGINKPSYYDFGLLHALGHERLANRSMNAIVTRRKDGSLAIAVWNLVDPGQHGATRSMRLVVRGVQPDASVSIQRVDTEHGNVLPVYAKLGKPRYPTRAQVALMNAATELPPPERGHLAGGVLTLTLESNALVLVTVASH
ncbi:MAG: glycosyl hydrolase family 39 [Rhodanobacter sp.]|nr:MAG: glycosyl hydrolase family 39 [Rhodanobacter sp.]